MAKKAKKVAKKKVVKAKAAPKKVAKRKAPAAKKAKKVEAVPRIYGSITPNLVVKNAAAAIAFYKKAFGAKEVGPAMAGPGGVIMHAELLFGDSVVMLNDEIPNSPG